MADVVMPRLSDTMEEGTVLRWLKREGELVSRGEELVEIETDKATMTYEADLSGGLEIVAREGDTLAVGEIIARIGDADRAGAASAAEQQADGQATTREPPGAPPTRAPAQAHPTSEPAGSTPAAAVKPLGSPGGEQIKASPLARRIAHESGVDLHTVTGTGPGGRIVKADVQTAVDPSRARSTPPSVPPAPSVSPAARPIPSAEGVATAKGQTTTRELSRTQRTIARRMAESKATIPDFTLQMEIDMEACVALRAERKQLSEPAAPTYNDMLVKACALALREHPRANCSYRDGHVELHSRVNVGVAVALESDDPIGGALVVPTVFDADVKALEEIASETRVLTDRVRAGTITPPELGGATFTVSNLGMYGVRSFTAIVNPPQAAILSAGSVAPRAVVLPRGEGHVIARQTMVVTLVCDHRALYGAEAAKFLSSVRELLEEPAALTP